MRYNPSAQRLSWWMNISLKYEKVMCCGRCFLYVCMWDEDTAKLQTCSSTSHSVRVVYHYPCYMSICLFLSLDLVVCCTSSIWCMLSSPDVRTTSWGWHIIHHIHLCYAVPVPIVFIWFFFFNLNLSEIFLTHLWLIENNSHFGRKYTKICKVFHICYHFDNNCHYI